MAAIRLASYMQGIELWESNVDPNGTVTPIGIGSLCIVNVAPVQMWQCTALPSTWTQFPTSLTNTPLSDISAAVAVNSIDSLNFAQTWAWSTATTQTPFTWTANALTSGSLFALSSTSLLQTGTILSLATASTAAFTAAGALNVNASAAHTGNLVRMASATLTGVVLAIAMTAMTSGTGVQVSNTSAAMTGAVLAVSSNSTAAVATGIVDISASGAYTGGSLVNVNTATVAGVGVTVSGSALVSGALVALSNTSATHTGVVLGVTTNTTAAPSQGAVRLRATGAHTANFVQVESATATGNILAIPTATLTTGTAIDVTSSGAGLNSTNGLVRIANTNAATAGVLFRAQSSSAAGSGLTVLCNGNTGLGTATPLAGLHLVGSLLYGTLALGDFAAGGAIGTAAATVDVSASFNIGQTTAGQVLSLPNPTNTTAGRRATVANTGTQAFTIHGVVVTVAATPQTAAVELLWNGTAWVAVQ